MKPQVWFCIELASTLLLLSITVYFSLTLFHLSVSLFLYPTSHPLPLTATLTLRFPSHKACVFRKYNYLPYTRINLYVVLSAFTSVSILLSLSPLISSRSLKLSILPFFSQSLSLSLFLPPSLLSLSLPLHISLLLSISRTRSRPYVMKISPPIHPPTHPTPHPRFKKI